MKILFVNTGHSGFRCWVKELEVKEEEKGQTLIRTGRHTYLAKIIEKFLIRKKFLYSTKRKLRRELNERQYRLLLGFKECGSRNHFLWKKALRERWSFGRLEATLFYKMV